MLDIIGNFLHTNGCYQSQQRALKVIHRDACQIVRHQSTALQATSKVWYGLLIKKTATNTFT